MHVKWLSCPLKKYSISTKSVEPDLLNDVVRSRIQFGFLQGRSKRLHLSFVGHQLEFVVLFEKKQKSVTQQILTLDLYKYLQ